MQKIKLGEVLLPNGMIRGPFGSALKKSLLVNKAENTYKVYEQGVVLEQNKSVGNYYITADYFKKMQRFAVKENDFLVSCSGMNYGAIYQLRGDFEYGVINQALLIIRVNPEIVDYNYFLYYFKIYIAKSITIGTGDSTIPNFPSTSVIKNIEIKLPPLAEQKKIGAFLYSLDEKISLNKKINATLEEMARTIYLHKFFRKAANGKLGDLILENPTSTISVGDAKNCGGEFPFFTSGENILHWKEKLVDGRNIFLNDGGNAGIKFYVGSASYSTHTWSITADGAADYLYLLLDNIKAEIDKRFFTGTGLKNLRKDLLRERAIYIPSASELEEFNRAVEPCFSLISKNLRENYQLAKVRDFLLPLLMNGQAELKEE